MSGESTQMNEGQVTLEQCPTCEQKALRTDEAPDLELELVYGEPYTRYTQTCSFCGYEDQHSEVTG